MENKVATPDYLPDLRKEDLRAAAQRRENYALIRDLQAEAANEAIVRRLANTKKSEGEDKD